MRRSLLSERVLAITLALAFSVVVESKSASWLPRSNKEHRIAAWNRASCLSSWIGRVSPQSTSNNVVCGVRGGSTDDEEERYSRQVYTLGARAHGLIRRATVYLDGPPASGLVYECAKNLALSGIHHLVLVTTTKSYNVEHNYHNPALDDLGRAYQRGARSEIFGSQDSETSNEDLLVEYLRRLNPNIVVSSVERSSLVDAASSVGGDVVFLCIDRPHSTVVSLNQLARRHNWSFIAVETAGVFGRVFCDFGAQFLVHDADGETVAITPLDRIERLDGGDDTIMVYSVNGEKHDVSKGDTIQFQFRNGEPADEQCVVTDVQTPYRFAVKLATNVSASHAFVSKVNRDAASFCRIKMPEKLSFQSIESVIESTKSDVSLFTPCDLEKSFDATRRSASLSCFQALSEFVRREQRLPTIADTDSFWELAQKTWSFVYSDGGGKEHCHSFLRGCAAKFTPFQAAFGAIAAQEVLKAATGLYYPVRQFLLYDCDEVLSCAPDNATTELSTTKGIVSCPASGLRYILGDATVDKLQKKKIFIVGAGAIGCEILKNLAPMGVGTRKKGKIVLTDMDTIEKSNLSRQLLFRDSDIGKFKSTAAQEAALRLNPSVKIEAHSSKVGATGEHSLFDDKFWSKKVDIVLNALDNVDARMYMDSQCVTHKKALVDAGTMGPKGNVQVVVPHQSESYASSVDPPEPSIPLCTLKNFPYAISHTIQWGRDLFDSLFQRRPEQANDFMDSLLTSKIEELVAKFIQEKGSESAAEIAGELTEDISADTTSAEVDVKKTREKALLWATRLAFTLFYQASVDLLSRHPLNSVDDDGEPFWSGTRRPPKMLWFDTSLQDADQAIINSNLVEFIRNGARLRFQAILGDDCAKDDSLFTTEEAERACIAVTDDIRNGSRAEDDGHGDDSCDVSATSRVQESLSKVATGPRRMVAVEFEKDEDSNGHVAFVSAASNLRAIAYGIPPVDAMETRRVAGNIVPAMITTTAFVSALSCIELVKLVQKVDLRLHRNAFINLALPFFAFTMPLPAEQRPGFEGKHYTLWDQLSIGESKKAAASGGITMKSLLKRIRKLASDDPSSVAVASISCGPFMLYANFLHEDDEDVLNSSVWELVEDAVSSTDAFDHENSRDGDDVKSGFVKHDTFVDLTVVVEDVETGDEVELPPLRIKRYREV